MSLLLGKRVQYKPYYESDKEYFGEVLRNFENSMLGTIDNLFVIKLDNGAHITAYPDQIEELN